MFHALKFSQTYHIAVSLPQKFCAVNLPLYGKFERENKLTIPWKLYTPDNATIGTTKLTANYSCY